MKPLTTTLTLLALALLTLPTPAPAQWGNTPDDPLPICTAGGDQVGQLIVRLGSGRYLVTWFDYRTSTVTAYYQLLTEKGEILLQDNGVLVFLGSTWGTAPYFLVSDGQGGCISVVRDYRNGAADIYGQRFDSLGNRLWGETGVPLILWPGTENVNLKDAEADANGNVFLAWDYGTPQYTGAIFIQKITPEGVMPWGNLGIQYYSGSYQDWQDLIPDNNGGSIVTWETNDDTQFLRAQHLNSAGNFLWSTTGIPVLDPNGYQIQCALMQIFPDGLSGGICVGARWGSGYTYAKIFRINGQTGAVPWYHIWGNDDSYFLDAVQNPINHDIYALRLINPSPYQTRLHRFNIRGDHLWGEAGIAVENIGTGQVLVKTSLGVQVVGRNPQGSYLRVQSYDSTGQTIWPAGGSRLFFTATEYIDDLEACADGEEGLVAIIRLGPGGFPDDDLYAVRMRSDGSLGNLLPPYPYAPIYTQREISVRGNLIQFTLTQPGAIRLELYDLLGRKVKDIVQRNYPAGETRLHLDRKGLTSGIYFITLHTNHGSAITKTVILQ